MTSMLGYQGPSGAMNQNATGYQMKEKLPSGYKAGQLQQFTPEQMQLFGQMFGHVSPQSYLSRLAGGDEEIFKQIEGPAMRQFGEFQGQLASRFSGMGLGARRGSGFQQASGQLASDLAQDLAARRQSLQQNAIRDLMGLSNQLLGQRPYDRFLIKKQQNQPWWKKALGLVSPIGGDIASGTTENTENFLGALGSFTGSPQSSFVNTFNQNNFEPSHLLR